MVGGPGGSFLLLLLLLFGDLRSSLIATPTEMKKEMMRRSHGFVTEKTPRQREGESKMRNQSFITGNKRRFTTATF